MSNRQHSRRGSRLRRSGGFPPHPRRTARKAQLQSAATPPPAASATSPSKTG